MGVRPPGNNDTEEPDVIAFGIATIDARLEGTDLVFPASAEEVLDAIGRTAIPYDAVGRTMELEAAVDQTDQETFETRQELLNELHEVFERQRENAGGVLDQIRALLPV